MLEKTHQAAEACRTLYCLLLESDSETKQQYIRWAKVQMEKYENDIDGILTAARELQETVYTETGAKAFSVEASVVFSLAKTRAKDLIRICGGKGADALNALALSSHLALGVHSQGAFPQRHFPLQTIQTRVYRATLGDAFRPRGLQQETLSQSIR
jgi:hypothetical protein